ncbi:MAG: DUF4192 domain-containing protein [Mycobacteriales bacterium]
MRPASAPAVARLTSPGEIVAALPHVCGFVPSESLVVVSLRGLRKRMGITMRFDLAACAPADLAAAEVVARLRHDQADQALLVVFTEQDGPLPRSALVSVVSAGCAAEGIAVHEALLVRDGRWFSYDCQNNRCCPRDGTPIPESSGSPGLSLLAAESVLDGRAVRGSRAELAASVAPPGFLAARAAEQAQEHAFERWAQRIGADGDGAERAAATARWESALGQAREGRFVLTAQEVADLAVWLHDIGLRDAILVRIVDESEHLLALLLWLARMTAPPEDAAVCTLLAVTAWVRGDGALANIALDRALATDPDYSLATLVRIGLDRAVPPRQVKQWLRASAA